MAKKKVYFYGSQWVDQFSIEESEKTYDMAKKIAHILGLELVVVNDEEVFHKHKLQYVIEIK